MTDREFVSNYCLTHGCADCKLNGVWTNEDVSRCINISMATDEELAWAVSLIGDEKAVTVEEALDRLILRMLTSTEWIETRPEEFANTLKILWELRK